MLRGLHLEEQHVKQATSVWSGNSEESPTYLAEEACGHFVFLIVVISDGFAIRIDSNGIAANISGSSINRSSSLADTGPEDHHGRYVRLLTTKASTRVINSTF